LQAAPKKIVALGGGAFAQKENARLIEAEGIPTVFLDAEVDELWRRCRQQAERGGIERPLWGSLERFGELYEARRRYYLKASFRQETDEKTIQEIATEVVEALGLNRRREKRGEK
jgi:shikimate kinase